jgi:hypothetical protein
VYFGEFKGVEHEDVFTRATRDRDPSGAAFFGVLAMAIHLIKSRRMDQRFSIFSGCSLIACALCPLVIMILMGGFVYGYII